MGKTWLCVGSDTYVLTEWDVTRNTLGQSSHYSFQIGPQVRQDFLRLLISQYSLNVSQSPRTRGKWRWMYSDENKWDQVVYIVGLTENEAAGAAPMWATVAETNCLFGFSPDGRQLAVSSQRTVRHKRRTAVRILVLDVVHTGTDQLPRQWITLYCDEKFNEGPRNFWVESLQDLFSVTKQPRLMFAVWDGRWVVGLWNKWKQDLLIADLYSRTRLPLAPFDLSCLDAFNAGMKNTIFSGNLEMVASYRGPTSAVSNKLRRGNKNASANSVVCATKKTNRPICTLKDIVFDQCWLSVSGKYIAVQSRNELKMFPTLKTDSE